MFSFDDHLVWLSDCLNVQAARLCSCFDWPVELHWAWEGGWVVTYGPSLSGTHLKYAHLILQGSVPRKLNNFIPGINVSYSIKQLYPRDRVGIWKHSTYPRIKLSDFLGTGPREINKINSNVNSNVLVWVYDSRNVRASCICAYCTNFVFSFKSFFFFFFRFCSNPPLPSNI